MRRAIRALLARPGFTIVAIATLTLGFGVNTAVFSLTRTVLLRPLPYRDADRLVEVNETSVARVGIGGVSPVHYVAWRERATAFDGVALFRRVQFNVSTRSRAVQVEGFLVSSNFFSMIGTDVARGRGFEPAEATAGRDDVVLLSDGFWRRLFNADPAVIGRSITVDGTPCTIVGVLPASFKIFRVLNRELDLFRPIVADPSDRAESLNIWARLKPNVGAASADAELKAIYASLDTVDPGWSVVVWPLSRRLAAGPKPVLVLLEWAVALVLLIACANVANLLLAMSAGRRKELAVRQALGASRWQIARDLGGEAAILTVAGGGLAMLLSLWSVATLNRIVSFQDINRLDAFRVDAWVLGFTIGLAAVVALLFGVLPAHASAGVDVTDALKDSTHGATTGASNRRLRGALIVGELALAIVLTVAAVALTRSAVRLHGLARGVSVNGVMTAQLALNDPRYDEPERMVRTTNAIIERLGQSPDVEVAALVNYVPLALIRVGVQVAVEGVPPPSADRPWIARDFIVSPDYFRAVGIDLVAGRGFTAADDRAHAGVAIVSERFAQRFWNRVVVVGRRITPDFGGSQMFWIPRSRGGSMTVVGVVKDVREDGLEDSADVPQLYLPYAQNPTVVATVVARAARAPAQSAAAAIREAVHAVDSDLPVSYEMTFDDVVRETFARPRELAWLIGSFAALALALAAVGVYGVMAFLTTARAREIAIRMAIGATRRDVVALVVTDAMRLAAGGGVVGLAATPLAFKFLSASVFGVTPWSPGVAVGVAAVLALVCAAAAAIPAWRAARCAIRETLS
jgi:putative ABC transport system permease protein